MQPTVFSVSLVNQGNGPFTSRSWLLFNTPSLQGHWGTRLRGGEEPLLRGVAIQALPMGTPWGCRGEAVLRGSRILVPSFYSYWKLLPCSSSPKCSMVTDAQACSASAGRSLVRGSQNISTGSPEFSSCRAKAKARFPDHLIQSAVRRSNRCGFFPTAVGGAHC